MGKQTIADQLERARLILSAAEADSELSTRLAAVGYDQTAIQAGQALYQASGGARTAAHAAHGNQLGATKTLDDLRHRVEANYSALAQIARQVFAEDIDALETLGLRMGQRATPASTPPSEGEQPPESSPPHAAPSHSQAAFLDRARVLYDAAMADEAFLAELNKVGYPLDRLQSERDEVAALEAADVDQEASKAGAKAGTAAQRKALKELRGWVLRFVGIVTPALKDRPDLLNKMGLKPRGRRRKG